MAVETTFSAASLPRDGLVYPVHGGELAGGVVEEIFDGVILQRTLLALKASSSSWLAKGDFSNSKSQQGPFWESTLRNVEHVVRVKPLD